MSTSFSKKHWEQVYTQKQADEVSWYQKKPTVSLSMIQSISSPRDRVIDIGGGSSSLVDHLLVLGYDKLAVLDIAQQAIQQIQKRLAEKANHVEWYIDDITQFVPPHPYEVWHDRAVFHFLMDQTLRAAYVDVLKKTLTPGGYVVMATFGKGGPKRCSGLDIVQYDERMMQNELGDEFILLNSQYESHVTPAGKEQRFIYLTFLRQ
ncbi:MAG: SAM-dependent methyltransferase [Gammaproteobacteria bacterium CG11_big_fil_rev_8_21_14_0_20_46_22]|nr:MAG: SAM-dependent methyltransferase [Gammaproteobacteria bacterium CG12_big_fil_rev_8_21_14_0_65_46_12]PIR11822.1 MAG: SAM-dependent methyltransferase [Gammaproteobacteria bacterium CG11_big_fil_rev_8_21_14_0_20_46_22]